MAYKKIYGTTADGYCTSTFGPSAIAATMLVGAPSSDGMDSDSAEYHAMQFVNSGAEIPNDAELVRMRYGLTVVSVQGSSLALGLRIHLIDNTGGAGIGDSLEKADYGDVIADGEYFGEVASNAGAKLLDTDALSSAQKALVLAQVSKDDYTNFEIDAYWIASAGSSGVIASIGTQENATVTYRPYMEVWYNETVDITKSLAYSVVAVTTSEITKGLEYAVQTDSEITKPLAYTIETFSDIQKTLEYALLTETAITKGLVYSIQAQIAITKGLEYKLLTDTEITKELAYAIETSLGITKSLNYLIIIPQEITKSLNYEIITIAAITKGLSYSIFTESAITKQLQYTIKTITEVTKGLAYIIQVQGVSTKTLEYVIRPRIDITKGLQYAVIATVEAIEKNLSYVIRVYPYCAQTSPYTPKTTKTCN